MGKSPWQWYWAPYRLSTSSATQVRIKYVSQIFIHWFLDNICSSVKCFQWRVARECGRDRVGVKCSLKHRAALDNTLESTQNRKSVTFLSPGFYRQNTSNPKGAYFNRNFCIFNISLNCDEVMVEMTPLERTNSLSDPDTCQDYLSFHTHSSTRPDFKLCGRQIMDATQYRLLPSSSFYGVLWTNDNKNERGRFEVEARCKTNSETDYGSGKSQ